MKISRFYVSKSSRHEDVYGLTPWVVRDRSDGDCRISAHASRNDARSEAARLLAMTIAEETSTPGGES